MATDTKLPDMAVDREGLGAGPTVDKSHMQELAMLCIFANQVVKPDPEPETQELLLRKHKVELDNIYAKRQKAQG